MKFRDEFRDAKAARDCLRAIKKITTRSWSIMEICGGQTHAIVRYGIDQLLPESVHLGAMAGTVDALLRIFTGVETRDDVLWLNPFLPKDLKELRLRLRCRGNELKLAIRHTEIGIETADFPALPITVGCRGNVFELKPGSSQKIDL